MSKNRGFTLVELLIVVMLVGILAGITASVVNTRRQQEVAEDAKKRAVVASLAEGIENYRLAEGSYPPSSSDQVLLGTYLKTWPDDFAYIYKKVDDARFVVCAPSSSAPGGYLVYDSGVGNVQLFETQPNECK